jgi:3-deoxy-D-manno-octulosonic-acid transferase
MCFGLLAAEHQLIHLRDRKKSLMIMTALIVIYNVLMLVGLCLLCPVWPVLLVHREKHRRLFFNRLFMHSIDVAAIAAEPDDRSERIWVHALSVGEVLSAEPLVKALAQRYGSGNLVFTASTQTGFTLASRVISPYVSALRHFPYDTILSVKRSVGIIRPRKVVIVETDIWPNFLFHLHQRRIPVYLVNARLSDRSFRGYRRLGFLMMPLLSVFDAICVQSESDRLRFRQLGVADEKLAAVGNIKFDQAPVSVARSELDRLARRLNLASDAPIWVAGSTHDGEEEMVSAAFRRLQASGIDAAMIVAPRDPTRAKAVCTIFKRSGIDARTLSQIQRHPKAVQQVVVIDRIGVLRRLYALADVAFVGGSLVKAGGHNPLEPAAVGKPILFGPHTEDFRWICQTLEHAGGAIRVSDSDQLAEKVCGLLKNPRHRNQIGRRAFEVFGKHQGAVERTLTVLLDADQRVPWPD